MASARALSPAGDASSPTSLQLTPRSKLKAMLAAVDDESSDEESTGPIDTKALFAAIDKTKQKLNVESSSQDISTDEQEDEDSETVRPRGRLAARMHANFTKRDRTSRSPSDTPRRARQDQTSHSTIEQGTVAREPSLVTVEKDDEDDIVAPSRRRLVRPNRGSTPEATVSADRHSSPSLFVSPSPHKSTDLNHDSDGSGSEDDDVPIDLSKNARFRALVEKKRKERLDKEAEEERKRVEHAQRASENMSVGSDADEDDVSDISDDDGGRKLTQEVSRPTRKTSKKALEEMNRETQRLSRSLQLAHEAKTKKKISKDTLFKRFNFRAEGHTPEVQNKQMGSSRPTTPGSIHQTDAELEDDGTPPSSPPSASKVIPDQATETVSTFEERISRPEDESKDLLLEGAPSHLNTHYEAKGEAVTAAGSTLENKQSIAKKPVRRIRVKLPPKQVHTVMTNSDDELEITKPKKKDRLDAIFSRIPEGKSQESTGMKVLRNLAHLSSPSKEPARRRNVQPSMTLGELHMSLQQRAKAQAKLERERRLEFLRSKGVVIQSAEEREREREQVEDIVARARQEVEEIMTREREEAKRNRKEKEENGEMDPLSWDDSDDSFQDNEGEELDEAEFSGSEEVVDHDDESVAGINEDSRKPMFMDEAEEVQTEDEEATKPASDDFSDEDIEAIKRPVTTQTRRAKKHTQIISDDEDDEDEGDVEATPKPKSILFKSPLPGSRSPKAPTSVLRSATKSFIPGLPIAAAAPAGLGLTQIFAGTMDDSQVRSVGGSQAFMPTLDQFPDSQFSATAAQSQGNNTITNSQLTQLADTQSRETQTQGLQLHYSQSQTHGFDSLVQADATQVSDFLEPTQDGGFQDYTPLKQRFVDPPQSTAGTILLTGSQDEAPIQESPLMRKRGKFLRRVDLDTVSSTLLSTEVAKSPERVSIVETSGLAGNDIVTSDAFRLMNKAARREKRLKRKFDKKKSKAVEMVEEQAEESEDEYAGLGGADGEDSSDEDEELAKEMIDDTGDNDGDAAKLAGLFADRERAADAAQVDKLFRDITTGMLRKRRRGGDGHDFDLSDSDDGGEARRRMKRRQFAKMQKALFADERIGKIAENPRNAAFLKSIEDMNDDDEWNFDENFAETTSSGDDSQSQNASQADQSIPDSQPPTTGRKRSRTQDHARRPGPSERRTKELTRPSSIAEVRRSLSTLLDEPNASAGSIVPATEIGSDSDGEEERPSTSHSNKENRRAHRHTSDAVVDRITLKRNSSSSLSTASTSTTAKLAFTAPATTGSGFKVPALLRRATTNSTKLSSNPNPSPSGSSHVSQASASGTSGSLNKASSFGEDGKLKKNAGKRSGINYFAHENERRAKVADAEKRREAKKWKGAEGRSKVVGGLFGIGSFE
ncbi:MRC1-like domain-containing protein [Xylaria sp. FL0064]|nr:MRC1-like domain-containing protein [Xylaria sp. FL0064]